MFDGVHLGHRHLWQQIAGLCLSAADSTLAVTFRNHPLRLIAPQRAPLSLGPVEQRAQLLRQAGADDVLILDFTPELRSLTGAEFVNMLVKDHGITDLVMGFNNSIGSDRISSPDDYRRLAADTGVRLHPASEFRLGADRAVSSSAIRSALAQGDVDCANSLLGRPYSISGTITRGKQLGRTIGFPTANIEAFDPRQAMPGPGVYALDVILPDDSIHRAMANIGRRPTVDRQPDAPTTVEVNIFDFEGDLYGQPLTLLFLKRLRSEQRFDSLEALRSRLEEDRRLATAL